MDRMMLEQVRKPSPLDRRAAVLRRRQQVLIAALEVFASRGYHDAAMDEIARRAGMSKPVLYKHFPSKLDLYLAVLQSRLETLAFAVHRAAATGDKSTRLRAVIQAYFDLADTDTAGFRLIFDSPVATEPSVEWRLRRTTAHCVEAITVAIAPGGASTDEHRVLATATALIGIIRFTASTWIDMNRAVPKREAVDTTFDLCWGGLSRIPLRRPYSQKSPTTGDDAG